jgi:hypothetical protein
MFDRGFYRCDCGWDGNKLVYAGSPNNDELLEILASQRNVLRYLHLRHPKGQGCCPNCGKAFDGCVEYIPEENDGQDDDCGN